MPCSIGHSWWHMEQHLIQHSLYHGKVPVRLQLLSAKTIHLTASLWADCVVFAWLMWFNQCCIIIIGILLKGMAPKLMNISYILSTTEEKRQKGRTLNVRILPTPEAFDTGGSGSFFEQTHFSKHINETEYQFRPRIWSSRLLRYVCTTCPLREGGGRCLQE